jgi:hypothetical protein
VALLLALPSADALAGGLYRWVTSDGRVEIGPTPPPGVNAVPWIPGQPETSPGAAPPAAPAKAAPAEAPRTERAPRTSGPAMPKPKPPATRAKVDEECASLGTAARNLARQVAATEL